MKKTKALVNIYRKEIFWTSVVLTVLSSILYVVLINVTVRNVVKRSAMEAELSHLSTHIGEMEFSYIQAKNKIDLKMAESLGYKTVAETKYVSRQSSSVAFAKSKPSN